jgi:hypothetical protein
MAPVVATPLATGQAGEPFHFAVGEFRAWTLDAAPLSQFAFHIASSSGGSDYALRAYDQFGNQLDTSTDILNGNRIFVFNGAVDANGGYTPGGHKTHDLGMAFDLGLRYTIGTRAQERTTDAVLAEIAALPAGLWTVENALAYSAMLESVAIPLPKLDNQEAALRDFLAMYSVVRSDPAQATGTWDTLTFKGETDAAKVDQIRAALFGDGTLSGSLISQIHIGGTVPKKNGYPILIGGKAPKQNGYPNMIAVLAKLGFIRATNIAKHHNHFHIYLKPPKILEIGGSSHLQAEVVENASGAASPTEDIASNVDSATTAAIFTYAQSILTPGEPLMFAVDFLAFDPQSASSGVALLNVAIADVAQLRQIKPNFVIIDCQQVGSDSPPSSAERGMDPASSISVMAGTRQNPIAPEKIKLQVLQGPAHGTLTSETDSTGYQFYTYDPAPGYIGKDQVIFLGEIGGKIYKVISTVAVVLVADDHADQTVCPESAIKKVSGAFGAKAFTITYRDLAGSVLGATTSTGSDATLTLDTNAAGYGWFLDATPEQNEEFLPTSDPSLWLAKEGSAAYGKVDMLSVLLHKFGHALGFEHSGDSADLMAPNLAPGLRRLPTPDQLQLMRQRIAELSGGLPEAPLPGYPQLPLAGLGLIALGRLRSDRYAFQQVSLGGVPVTVNAVPMYETAMNAAFVNGGQRDLVGWTASGNALVDAAGQVTLGEDSIGNARLSQTFMLNRGDRFLSFRIAENALQPEQGGSHGGPGDAFEIALLNADTGAMLVGTDGLSNSDALLNIQSDGTESRASSVHRVVNADGTSTYFVDLQSLSSHGSTAARLSFDLIGFGAHQSRISLSDIRMVRDPLAFDDLVVTSEDMPLVFSVLANDLVAEGAEPAIELMTNPEHGMLSSNPDGSFSYIPDADFYGDDAFSYRYVVEGEVSNIATVRLRIASINDAPTAPNDDGTVMAGKPFTFAPLAGASDVDGDTLAATIIRAPSHGLITSNADGTFTYVADVTYVGTDSVTYQISDGKTVSDPIVLTLTVTPSNTAPVARDTALTILEDGRIVVDFTAFGNDGEGDVLNATVTAQPTNGVLSRNADGTWTYTQAADFFGTDELRFTLSDGQLVSAETTLSFTISAVNDAPTLAGQAAQVDEDGAVTMQPLASAVDIDSVNLAATIVTGPAHGTLTDNPDGR